MIKSTKSLLQNKEIVKNILKDCGDIVYKEFRVGEEQKLELMVVYTDGMINPDRLNDSVLGPLMVEVREVPPEMPKFIERVYELLRYGSIPSSELKEIDDIDDAVTAILTGDSVLFIDGTEKIIVIGTKGWPARGVAEPSTESVIRGPRDGFTETYRMNTAMVRRRIRDPKLKLKQKQIGRRSKTDVGIFYVEDIAMPELLEEVERRLDTIDIDGILDSGYIEQLIEDNSMSPFPQVRTTERPDEIAASVLEGRIAILVDNSPYALVVPTTLNTLFHSPEDHYDRWILSTVLRVIRFFAGILSLVLPSLYIAVTAYDPGILPTKLVLSIAASREGVPFPALIEALLMEFTLELLREAGIRLPVAIGSTIGIVGGLVIGQAAVEAGIVSPIMVIIVAVTAISSFAIPGYSLSVGFRLMRFLLMILAGILGLYGIELGVIFVLCHLVRLKSFGVPYLSPYVAFEPKDLKDSIIRAPLYNMERRPVGLARNKIRLKDNRNEIKNKEGEGQNDKQ